MTGVQTCALPICFPVTIRFGGFVLGILETYSSAVFGTAWKAVISFMILVLVLLFKPTGLFGESIQQARV